MHASTRWTAALAVLLAMAVPPCSAQADYPNKPIKLIVPMPPGGGTDFWARLTMAKVASLLGQPIIIDNRPGGGTMIGAEAVARAPADGYTLLVGDSGTFSVNPSLYKKMSYDPVKDFSIITLTSRQPLVLAVPAGSPIQTVAQLVAAAKSRPAEINYGSTSIGSPHHLAMEMFQSLANIKLNHIPYKGGAPLANDLLGSQLEVAFLDLPVATAHLKSGRLRGLAVFSAQRLGTFPSLPTLAEAGYPGQVVEAWQGLVAPAGTPKAVLDRIGAAYAAASKDPEILRKLSEMGVEPTPSSAQDFSAYMKEQTGTWRTVIREKHITID